MQLDITRIYTRDDITRILHDNLNLAIRNARLNDELDRLTAILADYADRLERVNA